MLTVIVADIFGNSVALQQLATQISPQEIVMIDPYEGKRINFENEQRAYDYFNEQLGLTAYANLLHDKLKHIKVPFNLIAFSVGGSAVWLNAEMLSKTKVNRVVCFYASQIRHHLLILPSVAIELILPCYEPHFDIKALDASLSHNKQLTITQSQYLHGFMNPLSSNFNQQGYDDYKRNL